jgi:DNA polymerase III subunit chi
LTEVSFYHLQRQPAEAALPRLLERSLARGWRALVRVREPERLKGLDDRLWDYADESFLPHGRADEPGPEGQPVLLTADGQNRNGAAALFLLDGAEVPDDLSGYERVALLFEGGDEEAVAAARMTWQALKEAGHELSYWQQDDTARWVKKA